MERTRILAAYGRGEGATGRPGPVGQNRREGIGKNSFSFSEEVFPNSFSKDFEFLLGFDQNNS